jgi:cellulose synthase/poly-beta-1,6-N-acetylglucosamine synthase-like glycosyltransferase
MRMNAFQFALAVVFWVSMSLVTYAYVGYPLVVWCLSRWFGRWQEEPTAESEHLPSVSLLIAAYNEAGEIGRRLESALRMNYPPDRLEIVVASDGSSDGTADIVRSFADRGVRLLDHPERRGKAAALNAAFSQVRGEVVLLSDANTDIAPGALRRMVRWLRRPRIGVVCGRLVLRDPQTGRNVDSLYWKYETFLKKCEGRLDALLGSNGAIYAIRRALFDPIPNDTIVDDFVIPLRAKLRTGCGIVYDSDAVAWEQTPADLGAEFHRRSRIGAGGFQSIGLLWKLLDPRHGWVAFTFFSHKVLRWLCPFFLVAALVSNSFLWEEPFYLGCLLGQLGFYIVSLLAASVPARPKFLKPLRLTTMFTAMNAALLVGFWRWLRGSQAAAWKRTARLAEVAGTGG